MINPNPIHTIYDLIKIDKMVNDASFHLTPKRECFSSYTIGDYGHVKMGNVGSCKIVGMGDVCLITFIGCRLMLKDVCHVLDVKLNMISVGWLVYWL